MGVATGCGCKEVYRFPHTILIPIPLVSVFFCSIIPIFVHFLNVFRSLDYIECREHNLYINFVKYYINNKINKE